MVSITSPADTLSFDSGDLISFAGSAIDVEDGDISASLTWTSSLDSGIGTGGNIFTTLSNGVHTITASATDSGGKMGSASISITVGAPPTLSVTVKTDELSYVHRESAVIPATVTHGTTPVAGAVVQITVTTAKGGTLGCSPTTDIDGIAKCTYKVNAKRDSTRTYTVTANASMSGYVSGSGETTFEVE